MIFWIDNLGLIFRPGMGNYLVLGPFLLWLPGTFIGAALWLLPAAVAASSTVSGLPQVPMVAAGMSLRALSAQDSGSCSEKGPAVVLGVATPAAESHFCLTPSSSFCLAATATTVYCALGNQVQSRHCMNPNLRCGMG